MASSGSAQRAFVGRRNKMTAADVRRHLMTGSLITHPAAQSIDSAATSSTMISLLEVVDPVDVEDTLSQRKASSLIDMSCGALSPRKVSEFPADDVEVRIVSRESQTVDPPVTCDLNSDEVDPHVRDIMSSLCDQFSLMQRRYQQFGTGDAYVRMLIERPIVARSAPLQVYENDVPNADRITRSASIVETDESKRNSFASTVSSSTMASSDTTALEPRLHQSQPDPTVPYVIQRLTPQQMDNTNETKRQAGRQPYVVNLLPPQLDSDVIEKRSAPPFPEERITHKLIIKVVKLHMEPFFEPIFGAIALYDAKARRKVTENFYFDLNPSAIHELISPSQPAGVRFGDAEEALERCSQAAFHLSVPLHDLFIVVKLEKVLQACDVFDASEPYVSSSRDEKIRERLASVARTNCSRLGKYRMPLGFLVIDLWRTLCDRDGIDSLERVEARSTDTPIDFAPLASGETDSIVSADRISVSTTSTFRRIGSGTSASTVLTRVRTPLQRSFTSRSPLFRRKFLGSTDDEKNMENQSTRSEPSLANLQPFHRTYTHFYRQESERITEDELLKLLADARKAGSKLSKMKTFPAVLTLQFSGVSGEELLTRLTPDMLRVAPFVAGPGAELTKDVLEFPSNFHYAVNVGFRNLLYLYPKSMNFAGRPGTARNIVLKVELMDGKEEPQKLLFCKGADVRMDTALFTSVIYHNKSPQLGDEIKLRIPEDLNDGHHLLFTFYHISCKTQTDDPVEFPIGYTWIPLCRDGRLSSGDFALPVSMDKLPQCYGYLSPEVALPNVRWIEQHKPLFSVSLLAASSVHTQDEHLERFVLAVNSLSSSDPKKPPVGESQLIATIQGVIKARPEPMIAFLYSILDKLIYLIANPPYSGNVSIVCFETLCQLVKICTLLLDSFCDRHGRSSLLTTYIHYFKIALKEGRSHSPMCKQLMESGIRQPGSPETQKLFHIIEGMERSVISQKSKHRAQESSIAATTNNRCLHEELLDLWVRCMGSTREMAFINAWFFLELLIKSMAEYLSMTGRLYLHRRSRFSDRFVGSVNLLSAAVCEHVISRVNQHHQQALSLATSWAFFLRDALSLMDRSYILGLVRDFNRLLAAKISASTDATSAVLLAIKLDFTRVVCSHEHYVILNLPFGVTASSSSSCSAPVASSALPQAWSAASASTPSLHPPSPGGSSLSSRGSSSLAGDSTSSCLSGLSPAFRSLHFLIGLVLSDLASVLETCQSRIIHAKSIGVVRNLLAAHEADSRLADPAVRARIAALYVPLIDIILDAASQLHEPNAGREHLRQSRFLDVEGGEKVSVAPQVALAIAGIGSTSQAVGDRALVRSETLDARKTSLSVQHTRQLLSCLCWVLKNMERSALRAFLREQPPARFSLLMGVLQVCVSNFEYKTVTLDLLEAVSMEGSRVENAVASCVGEKYGVRMRRHHSGESKGPESDERVLQTVLCSEAALCVLDTLEMAIRVVCLNGSDHLLFALPLILRTLMHMLSCNQSVQTLEHIFATQRAFVSKFPELVFEQETEQCGELCLQLLRHCASRLPAVRSQAAASLYLLMREAYESGGSLARVKMQITMSLSTLVSNGTRLGVWLNEDCLRRSLKTVLLYADHDQSDPLMRTGTNFSEQVKDLVFNLHMILSDTVKMKEFANDFHMTIDLMYRVAKGYQNNPDLRVTWLLNMASRQADAGLYAEAGLCVLHAAALAAEYLAMTHTEEHFPRGAVDFESLSENILEESAVSDDVVSPEMEGICESRHFTEDGLVHLVERGAAFLERAHMFEALPDVYKIIEPIVREWRDYARLSAMHARLSACLAKIEPVVAVVDHAADMWPSPLSSADKRCFGTYFRVGFYGSRFSDLDGEEFIYKEPPFTKLSEISSRLEGFYSDRFGAGVVEVIKDSNNVVRSSHHANKAYLQITYVEPYFDKWEQRRRPTHYERSHNIKRFVFATPFTRDGKAHGDLKDQYKRRTILATQHAFPYVKSRIRVVEREQRVLTPIEVAIEDVERKNRELCAAMAQNPPDAKMLQMVVQGCIGTQVNQGPLQVAHVFLADVTLDERGKPVDRLQNKLRLCFKDFSKKCADALALNKQLIQADQHAYQNELQKNYDDFSRQIAVILGIQNGASENKRHDQRDANRAEEALAFAAQLGPVTEV